MANSPRLAELADLITRREYNYAMCKARKHEEDLVRRYAQDNNMEYTTLADTIEDLYQAGIINDVSRENLHGIRILGNKAVHEEDNDPQDAKQSYELLKKELTAYSDKKYMNPVRTPVAVSKTEDPAEEFGVRRRHRDSEEGEIDVSYASNKNRNSTDEREEKRSSSRNQKKKKSSTSSSSEGVNLYTILKILIPVLIIVLLVVLFKSIFSGKPEETTAETTEVTTETTTEEEVTEAPTTQAPTTEAPTTEASVSYQIKGQGVNVRLASDPTTIVKQLDTGTYIGPVTDYENKTGDATFDGFARFTYDGKDVIVSKKFIEKATSQQ